MADLRDFCGVMPSRELIHLDLRSPQGPRDARRLPSTPKRTMTSVVKRKEGRSTLRRLRLNRRRVPREDRPYPTAAQLDLLRASLLPHEEAAPAWQQWKRRGLELQTVTDEASMRLFPLLWANRDAAGVGPEDRGLLKGVYRHTVAYNAAVVANAIRAAALLDEAGIPVLFIKGASIIAISGRMGFRHIGDADLLVPQSQAPKALSVLVSAGYEDAVPDQRPVGRCPARTLRVPSGPSVDLHWWAHKTAGDDQGVFDAACEATLLGSTVLTPSPTDCLAITVTNAFQVDGSPLRWVADAALLLSTTEIDWDVLVQRALGRPGVAHRLARGLEYLQETFDAPVPVGVLCQLDRAPLSWQERGALWAVIHRPVVGSGLLQDLERRRARRLLQTSLPDGTPDGTA